MSADDFPEYQQPPPPPQWMWTPWPARYWPRPAPPAQPPPEAAPRPEQAGGEIDLILADARARAHRLIEDSVLRAQELLEERRGDDWQGLERVRSSVGDLQQELQALHGRLDRIESLLQERRSPTPAPAPAPAPTPDPPPARASREDVAPPAPEVSLAPPWASAEEPPPPDPPPGESRPSHGPPDGPPGGQPPPDAAPPPPPEPSRSPEALLEPRRAPVEALEAVAARPHANGTAGNGVRFRPEDGSVLLRVAPVAGFQGLMRVQDALVRVPGIREAGVEAYAQGEARLRLRLDAPLAASVLASSLSELLGVAARVAGASVQERSLQLALE